MKKGFGIDFGTSNTLMAAYVENSGSEIIPINQKIDVDTYHKSKQLPSSVLLNNSGIESVGSFAKKQESLHPDKVISSVKSWLCNQLVDRESKILPWKTELDLPLQTPVDISSSIISYALSSTDSENFDPSEDPEIKTVITIPASFDEVARKLTELAVRKSGISNFTFLEEPLAALYSWISQHEDNWREFLEVGDVVLVCDIGGGTTDFTIVGVTEENKSLSLERISVGDHILLGGDNIDLALMYLLSEKAESEGTPLDSWQQRSVIPILRELKEKALSQENSMNDQETYNFSVQTRGGNLFAGSLSFSLPKSFFNDQIIEGFLPILESNEEIITDNNSLSDSGLPYESDPRFTAHLLSFLKQSYRTINSGDKLNQTIKPALLDHSQGLLKPTKVLFNGGVFNSEKIKKRITQQLNTWFPESEIQTLESIRPDESGARGAAYFSYLKSNNQDIPVKAGVPYSLYLGIKENTLAVPGIKPKLKGVCVLPQGSLEGSEFKLTDYPLTLKKGTSADFFLFASKERVTDTLGTIIPDAEKNLTKHNSITSTIEPDDTNQNMVPVTLRVKATEIGSLEIWMDEANNESSHQVEFKIR